MTGWDQDRDLLAAFGLQPDDRRTQTEPLAEGQRFVAATNELSQWGVWDVSTGEWRVFPQANWVGEEGRTEAIRAAEDEAEWAS